jgi:hypothetical protein
METIEHHASKDCAAACVKFANVTVWRVIVIGDVETVTFAVGPVGTTIAEVEAAYRRRYLGDWRFEVQRVVAFDPNAVKPCAWCAMNRRYAHC